MIPRGLGPLKVVIPAAVFLPTSSGRQRCLLGSWTPCHGADIADVCFVHIGESEAPVIAENELSIVGSLVCREANGLGRS
jgi:hypothetical protein